MGNKTNKRILYADPYSFSAHLYYNRNNIRLLSQIANVDVFVRKDYINRDDLSFGKLYESSNRLFPNLVKHKSKLGFFIKLRIGQFQILNEIFRIARRENYDLIFFSCIDIMTFAVRTKFSSENIAAVEHGFFYTVNKKFAWTKFLWRIVNPKIKICLLEPYFEAYIKETLHIKNPTFLLRHPINKTSCPEKSNRDRAQGIVVFGPGSSNNREIVEEICRRSSELPQNVHIMLRGMSEYSDRGLKVYKDKISRMEYDQMYANADYIILPYDRNYCYRTSGVLFDAIASGKQVIMFGGNTLEEYRKEYPSLFFSVRDVSDLIDLLKCLCVYHIAEADTQLIESEFMKFKHNYSDEVIIQQLIKIIS